MWFDRQPIFVTGLPRTGTTCFAEILEMARGVKYLHEPFNWKTHSEVQPHVTKYLRPDDVDLEFAAHCGCVFSQHLALKTSKRLYKRWPWWPSRLLVKDVHVSLATAWIDRLVRPAVVIVLRHPCAVAASWLRLGYNPACMLDRIRSQPNLLADFLQPWAELLRRPQTPSEQIGAIWGAIYRVLLRQQQTHPDWLLVSHEEICGDPRVAYQQCFRQLHLHWTRKAGMLLLKSTSADAGQPYTPRHISHQEPRKWKTELTLDQIEQVRRFTGPFQTDCYAGF